jgi:glycosyltransferase involved in cell wall biosynthesis
MIAILRASWVAGGAERYLTSLGESLRDDHEVSYFSLDASPTAETLGMLGLGHLSPFFRRWPADSAAIERATEDFDLFINGASHLLVEGRARQNWLFVFSPGPPASGSWPVARRALTARARRLAFSGAGRRLLGDGARSRLALYPSRPDAHNLRSYDRVVAISEYVRGAIRRKWDIPSDLLYPPADVGRLHAGPKGPRILSVGRFAPYGNQKRQDVLIEAFRALHRRHPGWELCLAGATGGDPNNVRHVESLQVQSAGLPVRFVVDAPTREVDELLAGASIYWHAAGYGVDEVRSPDEVEHFGISIVEAMASGAVPLVVRAGGGPEIIDPDRNGRLWDDVGELVQLTSDLIGDPALLARLAGGALARGREFSPERFREDVLRLHGGQGCTPPARPGSPGPLRHSR